VAILARVTHDLAEARGPDVLANVEVPVRWFEEGASVEIRLPRLLPCARCEGGGCDLCARRGAFEAETPGPERELVVSLPRQPEGGSRRVCLRLPGYGARDSGDPELPFGHLLLTLVPRDEVEGWAPAANLRKLEVSVPPPGRQRGSNVWIWALAACLVTLLAWRFFS